MYLEQKWYYLATGNNVIRKMSLCFMISYPVHVQLSWNSCRIPDHVWRHRLTWFHRTGRGLNVGNFHTDDGINYSGSDNLAPAWSQAPPHMNEHRQTQRHLWECVWSQTSVNPIRHGQAPTISSAEDSRWARNTTWSGACVSWTIPRNTTKSVIYHFSGSLVQDTFTSSRQYGGDVLWLLQFDWCT